MLPSLLTLSVTYNPQAMAMTHTHANNQSKRSLDTKERVKTYKKTQKTTANVVMPTLIQLHWLPVSYRIKFKLCCIIHAIHYGRSLAYLTETVQSVSASRSRSGLCSSSTSWSSASGRSHMRVLPPGMLCPTTSTLWLILSSSENCWNHTILAKLFNICWFFCVFPSVLAFG